MKYRFSQNGTKVTKIIILLSSSFYLSYLCSSFLSYQRQIPVKKEKKNITKRTVEIDIVVEF